VDAQVLESYELTDDLAPTFRVSFAKCPRCKSPFLAMQEEDIPTGWQAPERIYPESKTRLGSALPKPIQASLEEAGDCHRVKAYTASAIMCRKTLEGICAVHGVSERTLAASLKKLRDDGIIEERLFEWAEELRLSGNEAAHDVNVTISAADATDILDFTSALLEYVFTFRERFEEFKKRRASRGSAA
jgi:hypothetical protein